MSDERGDTEATLVQKWIKDQQEWQKVAMEYFDSMVKNDEFLVNLGNAMRGSLLAGKPYPGSEQSEPKDEAVAADDRIDEILHALHRLQGDVADLKMAVEDLERTVSAASRKPDRQPIRDASPPPAEPTEPTEAMEPAVPDLAPSGTSTAPTGTMERGEG